jgi:hypothetical protein
MDGVTVHIVDIAAALIWRVREPRALGVAAQ